MQITADKIVSGSITADRLCMGSWSDIHHFVHPWCSEPGVPHDPHPVPEPNPVPPPPPSPEPIPFPTEPETVRLDTTMGDYRPSTI